MSSSGSFFDFHRRIVGRSSTEAAPSGSSVSPFSVSELTRRIDGVIRSGLPGTVQVRGEVSNCRPNAASGHRYFTLKDAKACLSCVMFRTEAARLKFEPRDGMELLATGRVTVYAGQGKYQLRVDRLEPIGQGALELAFQRLRQKLEAEGLFAQPRKRAIPAYPTRVTLISSAGAAALQDMLKVLRRYPWVRLSLYPVPVQGDGAAQKIAAAIAHLGRIGAADVLILARGGGSLEDLWQFNEESVARAVAASPIPIVTGIGHEVDVSIADLVADYHAHTPTEAAQVVVQHWKHARDDLDQLGLRIRRGLRSVYADARHRLNSVERHEAFRRPLAQVERHRQLIDDRQRQLDHTIDGRLRRSERLVHELDARLERNRPQSLLARFRQLLADAGHRLDGAARGRLKALSGRLETVAGALRDRHPRHRAALQAEKLTALQARFRQALHHEQVRRSGRVGSLGAQLKALNPEGILQRGYSLTTLKKSGAVLRDPADLKPGDRLVTRLAQGTVESTVEDSRQLPLFE